MLSLTVSLAQESAGLDTMPTLQPDLLGGVLPQSTGWNTRQILLWINHSLGGVPTELCQGNQAA